MSIERQIEELAHLIAHADPSTDAATIEQARKTLDQLHETLTPTDTCAY